MSLFTQIMDAVKDARAACQRDAESQRRDFKFQHWRQTELVGCDAKGQRVGNGSAEPVFFDSTHNPLTKTNLISALRFFRERYPETVSANLSGGIDGGDTLDFNDCDYQPYIAEWDTNIDAAQLTALLGG